MKVAPLPITGQHSTLQAIVPNFDLLQRKVWFSGHHCTIPIPL
jgi:hypothetical protein